MHRRTFLETAALAGAGATLAPALRAAPAAPKTPAAGPLPIAVFVKHLQWLGLKDLCAVVAEAGFGGIDLPVRPGGVVLPERVEDDLPRAVATAREAGLAVTMITTAILSARDAHAERVLRAAGRLGIRHYRMGWAPYDKQRGVAGTLEALKPALRELAALNADCGISGGYQNHVGANVGSGVWDLWLLLKEVGSPWLGCQYDIRHAMAEGGQSWVRPLELIRPFILTQDIKDAVWERTAKGWQPRSVPLGEGMVDLAAYFRLLGPGGADIPISVHIEYAVAEGRPAAERRTANVAALRRDLDRLRAVLAASG